MEDKKVEKKEEVKEEIKEVKKPRETKLDIKGLNQMIGLGKRFLKLCLYASVVIIIYGAVVICKETGIFKFLLTLLKVISPLFFGIAIAWLLNPLVKWLMKKGMRRGIAAGVVYVVVIGLIALLLGAIIPTFYHQVSDFAKTVPTIVDKVTDFANDVFDEFREIDALDIDSVKNNIFAKVGTYFSNLSTSLPTMLVNFVSSVASVSGNVLISLVIGFFLLLSFDNSDSLISFLPKKIQKDTKELLGDVDKSLRNFIVGTLLDSLFIFVVSSIGLFFTGLKAPLLFGLFCGVTNAIPYAGPYIGAIPAIIVGFSQGFTTGLLTLIVLGVIQFIEGNFLQTLIMSKSTKLHPVTIILGLLVFGHFWGMLGMLISTPLIAVVKAIFLFFNRKYAIINVSENVEEEK